MKRDTTVDDGERYALHSLPAILYALIARELPQYATTSHQYGKAVAFGTGLFKLYATTAMLLRVVKSATMMGGLSLIHI